MKKSIYTVLFASLLFISLGGIFERVSTIYNSDERVMEIVELAKNAIGGDFSRRPEGLENLTVDEENIFENQGKLMIEEIKIDGKHKVVVRKDESGKVLTENFTPIDGKNFVIVKDFNGNTLTENEIGPR